MLFNINNNFYPFKLPTSVHIWKVLSLFIKILMKL